MGRSSAPSVEEVLLRRKAVAALSALKEEGSAPLIPPPTHLLASLNRSFTAPRSIRGSSSSPALAEAVAFGRRAALPPSPARTTMSFAKPPAAFLAMPMAGRASPQLGGTRGFHGGTILPQVPSGATMPPALTRGRSGASSLGYSSGSLLGQSTRSHLVEPPRTAGPDLVRETSHGSRLGGGTPHAPEVLTVSHSSKGGRDEEELSSLVDEIDDLSDRLAQIERVTMLLTPEYTHSLQRKLQSSFASIGDRMLEVDGTLLTEAQKRCVGAAVHIQAAARGCIQRVRYHGATAAIRNWRSRELADVCAPIVAWLRRREGIDEQIDEMRKKLNQRIMVKAFNGWVEEMSQGLPVRSSLDNELKARRHYRMRLCLRVLWGWKRHAHHAHLAAVRWVYRNGRRVALPKEMAECMESHLLAWRRFTHVSREATRRYGVVGRRAAARSFLALRAITVRRKALRRLTVARWRDHSKSYWQLPFRAWYLYMVDSKILRRVRAVLIGSFARKTQRRLLAQMLVAWHELAVHKTVETRSRSQLRVSLKAQEALTAAAEEALDEYARVLIDAERSLESESRTQHTLTRQADEARTELASLRLKCHTAQQECLRLRTLVRHYELRYPRAFTTTALTPGDEEARPKSKEGAAASEGAEAEGGAVDGGSAPPAPPAPPLIVSKDEASRLHRLNAAASAVLSTERYSPPETGGTSADHELRRLRALMGYVLSGALPEKASLELSAIEQESALRMGVREANAAARVLSDDLETLRDITVPEHLGGTLPPDASVAPLLPRPTFGDASITAAELHSVPQTNELGAEQVARRVRERREELQARSRHRVNLYATEEVVVETADEAAAAAQANAEGGGAIAQALMGLS